MLRFEPVAFHDDARCATMARSSSPAPMRCAASNRSSRAAALLKLPLFAVGEHTAAAARDAGFRQGHLGQRRRRRACAISCSRSVKAKALKKASPLLYLAGADLARDLAGELGERGFTVVTQTTYRMIPVSDLPREASDAFAANADRGGAALFAAQRAGLPGGGARRRRRNLGAVDPAMLHFRRRRLGGPRRRGEPGRGGGRRRTKMPCSGRWTVLCGRDRARG